MGGLALIAALAFLFFFRRKRTSDPESVQLEPFFTTGTHGSNPERAGYPTLKHPLQHNSESFPPAIAFAEAADIPSGRFLAPPTAEHSKSTKSAASGSLIDSQLQRGSVSAIPSSSSSQSEASGIEPHVLPTPAQATFHPGSNFSDSQLTDEQIDFVRSLWNANVAATDIARVIERMKSGVFDEDLRSGVTGTTDRGGLPPSYDSLRRQ